jgi:hypothetical protein
MKTKNLRAAFSSLAIAICLYVVFYPRIECKPNHVSFWFIFVLGMAFGVALTRLILYKKEKEQ